jgi:PhzF family phenazine biosynthesis protein
MEYPAVDRRYLVVDAFAHEPFTGNPAAVVLDAENLIDAEMQSIAAEFNLSETTFILPPRTPEASVSFRWFTPATEVAMCGHATIAGVHALAESAGPRLDAVDTNGVIRIDTMSGTLAAFVEDLPGGEAIRMIWLELPRPLLSDCAVDVADLSAILGLPADAFASMPPVAKTQDADLLVFVNDVVALNSARPDFTRLKEYQVARRQRGLCLATTNTLAESIHVQSRFFAPATGVDEDPVTGSVHGPLAAHLVRYGFAPVEGDVAALRCTQARAGGRAGVVYGLVQTDGDGSYAVRIGGQAITTMRGVLLV